VQVKLWDPLRMRAIPERLRGVFTTRRYTNPRLPLPLPLQVIVVQCSCKFSRKINIFIINIGCQPLDGVTRAIPLSDATVLINAVSHSVWSYRPLPADKANILSFVCILYTATFEHRLKSHFLGHLHSEPGYPAIWVVVQIIRDNVTYQRRGT